MAPRFAVAFACRRRISAGSRASIWSSFMKARAAISADFAANAARRSSTAMGRTGSRRRNFRKTPRRNTASRWRCSTIRRCGRRCTASSPARRRGSRSPTTCRNTRNIRRFSSDRAAPADGSLRRLIRQDVADIEHGAQRHELAQHGLRPRNHICGSVLAVNEASRPLAPHHSRQSRHDPRTKRPAERHEESPHKPNQQCIGRNHRYHQTVLPLIGICPT
jgi:hypothetical protein